MFLPTSRLAIWSRVARPHAGTLIWHNCLTICNTAINTSYAITLLHLPDHWVNLDSVIISERIAGVVAAPPGAAVPAILPVGQLPKLLPIIIIQVAVPGPA
jgi:hypothetical protein